MGKYKIEFRKETEKDLSKHKKSGDKATISKIYKIFLMN